LDALWEECLGTHAEKSITMPLGIVIRKSPGVTRWAAWSYKAVAVLPGAGEANWTELRREGDVVEYHAATCQLELHHTQSEAYMTGLADGVPSVYVIMRDGDERLEVLLATASPYEAQDYQDSGEELVEKVPMPEGLVAWVRDYALAHHEDEAFIKRRRDKTRIDQTEDGKGDARIRQVSDVYRSPTSRREQMH